MKKFQINFVIYITDTDVKQHINAAMSDVSKQTVNETANKNINMINEILNHASNIFNDSDFHEMNNLNDEKNFNSLIINNLNIEKDFNFFNINNLNKKFLIFSSMSM